MALQAVSLVGAKRKGTTELNRSTGLEPSEIAEQRRDFGVVSRRDVALTDALYLHALHGASLQRLHSVQRARYHSLHTRLHAEVVADLLAWTVANSREDRFTYRIALKEMERRRKPFAELEKWRIVAQGDKAFHISAGAFEIEHFHGMTNIRVIDASRVTVETSKRGEPLPDTELGILKPATYQ